MLSADPIPQWCFWPHDHLSVTPQGAFLDALFHGLAMAIPIFKLMPAFFVVAMLTNCAVHTCRRRSWLRMQRFTRSCCGEDFVGDKKEQGNETNERHILKGWRGTTFWGRLWFQLAAIKTVGPGGDRRLPTWGTPQRYDTSFPRRCKEN